MTPKQQQLLDFIRDMHDETGLTPTFVEMMAGCDIASKSIVSHLVDCLEADGHIIRGRPGQARGIRLPRVNLAAVPTSDLLLEIKRRERRS